MTLAAGGQAVVVGGSLAGLRAAEALRREGHDGPITIIGAEPHSPYDRPPLSKQLLGGAWTREQVELRQAPDIAAEFRLGVTATALDVSGRMLTLDGGEQVPFDGLVIATGATPRLLPGTPPLDGVFVLRTVDDCMAVRATFERRPRVTVIGAGFIGSEVASTARSLGLEVTVLEALAVPLVRVLGEQLGAICAELHRDGGTDLRLGVGVSGFTGESRVEGVVLSDGTVVPADVVVVGVGVAPATAWLESSTLTIDNGVVCDERCRAVGGEGVVVAAGDVARWFNPRFDTDMRVEHWTNAVEQAEAAARALVHGDAAAPFDPVPYFWSDQYGSKIQYVGHSGPGDELLIVEGDPAERKFVAAFGRAGRMVAAFALNRPSRIMAYRSMIASGAEFPPPPA